MQQGLFRQGCASHLDHTRLPSLLDLGRAGSRQGCFPTCGIQFSLSTDRDVLGHFFNTMAVHTAIRQPVRWASTLMKTKKKSYDSVFFPCPHSREGTRASLLNAT